MTDALRDALSKLQLNQRRAVEWHEGAILVLAGPGSGKTWVLTTRLARLLEESREKTFRVLALTFTNKAADEMVARVGRFVPGMEERAFIGTFHAFCTQVLRQHGTHIGIQTDFRIYAEDEDRRATLSDALRHGKLSLSNEGRLLDVIDRLKTRLVAPEDAARRFQDKEEGGRIADIYRLYEEELRHSNALDFNSLLLETHRLATKFPAIAQRYVRSYPFWMIDEFQDTNDAQYRLVKAFAGDEFSNVFVVADDDQIIYEWNGASLRHIQGFVADFKPETVQLPTNYRCPPSIVNAANRLVAHNATRAPNKEQLVAAKTTARFDKAEQLRCFAFADDAAEAEGVAEDIRRRGPKTWEETAVLARARSLLEPVETALERRGVPCVIAQRRDRFLSPEFQWLHALLRQIVRPLDRRNLVLLADCFERMYQSGVLVDLIIAEAEASGRDYLVEWARALAAVGRSEFRAVLEVTDALQRRQDEYASTVSQLVTWLFERSRDSATSSSDLEEDAKAWKELSEGIRLAITDPTLDQFLQQLDLRSKEPSPPRNAVRLMTIHGAKGTEFDFVYLVGLAEEVMPSFQSLRDGPTSPAIEEERRNCFVAITRTKECLTLSCAARYRGFPKEPSRFLREMGIPCLAPTVPD